MRSLSAKDGSAAEEAEGEVENVKKAYRPQISGQVVTEYVILLALCVVLVAALLVMFADFSDAGGRLLDLVSYDIP